jgi:hypothetical protein
VDTARHREPETHRIRSGPGRDSPPGQAAPALRERPSLDLWSLPVEPETAAATDPTTFVDVDAFMDVLALGPDTPAAGTPPAGTLPPAVPPTHVAPSASALRPAGSSSSGGKAVLLAVALVAAAGSALVLVLAGFSGRVPFSGHSSGGSPGGSPAATSDDRVVVPGPSADCLVWLVKPRPDGSTNGVPGTCFVVG